LPFVITLVIDPARTEGAPTRAPSALEATRVDALAALRPDVLITDDDGALLAQTEALAAGARLVLRSTAPPPREPGAPSPRDGRRSLAPGEPLAAIVRGLVAHLVERPAARSASRDPDDERRVRALTARELDVLRLLAAGASTKVAADKLTLSPKTVHAVRARLMRKVGADSVSDLTKLALRMGLTTID
jgi:DNA-binding NarL/FixJ family response regulator